VSEKKKNRNERGISGVQRLLRDVLAALTTVREPQAGSRLNNQLLEGSRREKPTAGAMAERPVATTERRGGGLDGRRGGSQQ